MERQSRVVVCDANVLINLIHVDRLDLCARLSGHEFRLPEAVRAEVSRSAQRAALDDAIAEGTIEIATIEDMRVIALFAELTARLGRGEAACLAIAVDKRWCIASDEKGRFRREVAARLGTDRLLGTAELLLLAIQARLLTIEEADAAKEKLERQRFKMPFVSFRQLLLQAEQERRS